MAPCHWAVGDDLLNSLSLLYLQLKTEAKRREQDLADLEKQDTSLSAQIAESKTGKEDSVSAQQFPPFPAASLDIMHRLS